jgi:hypothetical protein
MPKSKIKMQAIQKGEVIMKLCVATTWENRLIHDLLGIESNRENVKIYEIFGALQTSILGSGRESVSLPKVSEKEAQKHIELARSYGIKFNYLINCACMGNQEFSTRVVCSTVHSGLTITIL